MLGYPLPSFHLSWRIWMRVSFLLMAYIGVGHLGLLMATHIKNVSPVWPATGFAMAILLLWGWRYWPVIAAGAFIFNFATGIPVAVAMGLSLANTTEAMASFGLLKLWGFNRQFERQSDILSFFLGGGVLAAAVGASIGVMTLYWTGSITGADVLNTWLTWWSGDMLGALIVTPTLLSWIKIKEQNLRWHNVLEMTGILVVISLISYLVFFEIFVWQKAYTPLVFVFFPVLIWLGIRQGLPGVTSGLVVLCAIASSATYHNSGPFAGGTPTEDLVVLQTFMGLLTMTALLLTVIENERHRIAVHWQESEERYRALFELAHDAIVLGDAQGLILEANQAACHLYGFPHSEMLTQATLPGEIDFNHAVPMDRLPGQLLETQLNNHQGESLTVEMRLSSIQLHGQALVLAIIRDISERKLAEKQLKESLHEKEILLKEIHHRVKNNLQIISSLLNMQARLQQNTELKELIAESQTRIQAMALIHETFYQQEHLLHIDFMEYVLQLAKALQNLYGMMHILFKIEIEPVFFRLDTAIPCGLMLNELLSNCFKYAFPEGHNGHIHITLKRDQGKCILAVSDDGIGFDFPPQEKTLGLQLVQSLVKQLDGQMDIQSKPGKGTQIQIHFLADVVSESVVG